MDKSLANKISIISLGIVFLCKGISLIIIPKTAVNAFGMILLDGAGRSSQLAIFTSFYLGITIFCFLGAYKKEANWLYSSSILLVLAAVFRITAYLFHDANFVLPHSFFLIMMEIGFGLMLWGIAHSGTFRR